jgi:hypothetical protein
MSLTSGRWGGFLVLLRVVNWASAGLPASSAAAVRCWLGLGVLFVDLVQEVGVLGEAG